MSFFDKNFVALIDPRVLAITIEENNDPWIDLKEQNLLAFGPSPEVPDNEDYTKMRRTVYEKLIQAQASLPSRFKLKLYEGYRSISLQEILFNDRYQTIKNMLPDWGHEKLLIESAKLVSPVINLDGTKNIPPHSTGGAIDIYLINEQGGCVDMGIKVENWSIDINGSISKMHSNEISDNAKKHRKIMSKALTQAGFVNYPAEYWHWSYGDRYWAYCQKKAVALYGAKAN